LNIPCQKNKILNILKYSLFSFAIFFLGNFFMKSSKGNTNNLISVGAAKVLWYAIHPPNISIKPNYFITEDQSGLKSESLLIPYSIRANKLHTCPTLVATTKIWPIGRTQPRTLKMFSNKHCQMLTSTHAPNVPLSIHP
jgi:hypothetical protein